MNFGESLKFLRNYHGYNQKKVADYLEVGVSTYSQYENNIRQPNYAILKKLTEFFGVSYDFLFKDHDYMNDINFLMFQNYLNQYRDSISRALFLEKQINDLEKDNSEEYEFLVRNLMEVETKYKNSIKISKNLGFDIKKVEKIFDEYI